MQLRGRVLQRQAQGEDVQQLHSELLLLGFTIAESEVQAGLFESETYRAVIAFQAAHTLPQTGIVDEVTATMLTLATEPHEFHESHETHEPHRKQRTPSGDLPESSEEDEEETDSLPPQSSQPPPNQVPGGKPPTVVPPPTTPGQGSRYSVKGIVRDANGKVAAQLAVRVYEQLLRQRATTPLNEGRTDQNGFYQITYTPPRDARGIKSEFTIVVVVYNAQQQEWVVSPPVYRAQPVEEVNLMEGGTYQDASEYDTAMEKLLPLVGDIPLTQLVENDQQHDISFLSGQTGMSDQEIMMLVIAHHLTGQTKVLPEFFFGLFKEHLPKNLPASLLEKTFGFTMLPQLLNSLLRGVLATNPDTVQVALTSAVDANFVPPWVKRQISEVIHTLNQLRIQYFLDQPNQLGKVSLSQLLGETSFSKEHYPLFVSLYDQYNGTTPPFWKALSDAREQINPAEVADLQFTLQLGVLIKNHLPLLRTLKQAYQHGQFSRLGNLAHLDVSQWEDIIRSSTTPTEKGYPPNIDGNTEDEKIASYAQIIVDRFERVFPTIALSGYINRSPNVPEAIKTDVLRFFSNNPDLNLRSTNLNAYLKDQSAVALAGIVNPQQTLQQMRGYQRALQLAPTAHIANILMEQNLTSAQRIYAMGKSNLLAALSAAQLDAGHVAQIYANAELKYAILMARLTEFNFAFNRVLPSAILPPVTQQLISEHNIPQDYPNLQGLFGSVDYCDCAECQSVYSAAAYLVDILDFLRQRRSTANTTAKDILFKRRADIGDIDLNCDNTNIPLPYIDLVNEILESDLSPLPTYTLTPPMEVLLVPGPINPTVLTQILGLPVVLSIEAEVSVIKPGAAWGIRDRFGYYKVHKESGALHMRLSRQTLDTAEDLQAHPAYVNIAAYDILRKANYPMTLPFHLWWDEATTYLAQLDSQRDALMKAFQNRTTTPEQPSYLAIAAETFGIHSAERTFILTADATQQSTYWGTSNPVTDLATVSTFLKHAGFIRDIGNEYQRLLELLATLFVNPLAPDHSEIVRGAEECNIDQQTITNLSPDKLDRAHRFIRLWRKTGWHMWELDLLIRSPQVGNGILHDTCLQQLQHVQELQSRLKLSTEELLAFYQPLNIETRSIGTAFDDPLYTRLFLNKAVVNPVNRAFEISKVTDAGTTETLTNQLATIQAALTITESDFSLLSPQTDGKLTLANLSFLYRYAKLARVLRLSIKDLLLLLNLTGIANPFASLEQLTNLLDLYQVVTDTHLTLAQMEYLLTYSPASLIGLSTDVITQYLTQLRTNLQKAADAIYNSGATPEDTLGKNLAKLDAFKDPQDVKKAVDLVRGAWSGTSAERDTFIATKFADFLDTNEAKTKLGNLTGATPGARETEIQMRFAYVLDHLYQYTAVQTISETIGGQLKTETQTLRLALNGLTLNGATLLSYFNAPALLAKAPNSNDYATPITPATFGNLYLSMIRLHKVAFVVSTLKITPNDFQWLMTNAATYGNSVAGTIINGLDFAHLPIQAGDSPIQFQSWRALVQLYALSGRFPAQDTVSLFTILSNLGSQNATFDALSQWTNGNRNDIADIHSALNFQYPQGYHFVDTYTRLFACVTYLRRLGVQVATLQGWLQDDITPIVSDQIKQTVKSRYEQSQWLTISAHLQDGIREKKRQALVDYELANPKDIVPGDPGKGKVWHDSDSLFAYFLVDIEMSACQLTSRIVQANGSIQLFVQRCFLNLEPQVVVDATPNSTGPYYDEEWFQWKWMKNYRVWEANRKVFLYPENWIEPELRTDKSPFFKDLENDLHQGDITNDYVEDVFLRYLEKLDDVSRLDVCGMYHHIESDTDILHVIARTRATPHIYYYRQWVNRSSWTAWEKIELDIPGEQVVPVVYNRKLYLFWPVYGEKPERKQHVPATPPVATTPPPHPKKYLEIQLGWSYYRRGKWATKSVSKAKMLHPWDPPTYLFSFVVNEDSDNNLFIDLYLSSAKEFNNDRELDANGEPTGSYTNPLPLHNETALPWHNTRFVFTGDVTQVEASTQYGMYAYIQQHFGTDGLAIVPLSDNPPRKLPNGEHYKNNTLTNNVDVLNSNLNVIILTPTLRNGERVLTTVPSLPFQILHDVQQPFFQPDTPYFFEDATRTYFVVPQLQYRTTYTASGNTALVPDSYTYTFYDFYHPYTKLFMRELNRIGITGVLNRTIQVAPESLFPQNTFFFDAVYHPNAPFVSANNPHEIVDFTSTMAYAQYNWELFFHAPLMVAARLTQNQRFEEAMQWFHYIFDPTNPIQEETPKKYWITKPFYNANRDDYRNQRIENLLKNVNAGLTNYLQQVQDWRDHPFEPHRIARFRTVAYQWTVVMKYIDNLIAWGDYLFRQDTMEEVNLATQMYIMAADILGPRPIKVPSVERQADKSYNELESELDAFGNALEDYENMITATSSGSSTGDTKMPKLQIFYFRIPPNQKLLTYWDTVADRLFKIRHCMNIEGVVRQLPLFAPPIDPALLVQAVAAGIDIGSVLNSINAPLPNYRFVTLIQKASEFCRDVQGLGLQLLAALERKDAEAVALLRSGHELQLLQATQQIRQQEVDEAWEQIGSLQNTRIMVDERRSHYDTLLSNGWNDAEKAAMGLLITSTALDAAIAAGYILAGGLALIPKFVIGVSGFGGSPSATGSTGGPHFSQAAEAAVLTLTAISHALEKGASIASTIGSYTRRSEEWDFQKSQAVQELTQVDKQISAATIRWQIAQNQQSNLDLQIQQTQEVDDYMHSKYTNQDLYDWMITQISTVYFQAYQVAYDIARRAEKAYQFETGQYDTTVIQFGYWDSLKKGLLSGEKLALDLRRLESAYLDQNKREYEITKHISLAQFDPVSLMQLKTNGTCTITLPELLFDMDYPGHYMRRLKSLSISIPCVVGPYTSINCTLTLLKNSVRLNNQVGSGYPRDTTSPSDDRFRDDLAATQSIATSHGQEDSGLFELNFRDERYLPFEGAGLISQLRLDLPQNCNQFDFTTISDVILHLRYTARDGGDTLRQAASDAVQAALPQGGVQIFDLRGEFPTEWYRFLYPDTAGSEQALQIPLSNEHFPFLVRSKTINVTSIELLAQIDDTTPYSVVISPPLQAGNVLSFTQDHMFNALYHLKQTAPAGTSYPAGAWTLKLKKQSAADFTSLDPASIHGLYMILAFTTA